MPEPHVVVENPSAPDSSPSGMGGPSIYCDNLATTAVDPRVLNEMLPFFTEHFGNAASSSHAFGWRALEAVERARRQVAGLIGARSSHEIVFTSGATEANNLAIKGVAAAYGCRGNHIVSCVTEHKAVVDCCNRLQEQGWAVTYLDVDAFGRIDLQALDRAISERTVLVSIMAANNEIGTIQALRPIGELIKQRGVLWHCDAAQAVGKIELSVADLGIDLLSLSGHKMYGPKGIGALYVRSRNPRVRLKPQIDGGGHERSRRSGTLNVPGIVGLGTACALCAEEMRSERLRLSSLRRQLHADIVGGLGGVRLNGHPEQRLPGCLHLSFEGVDSTLLLTGLRDVAVSTGSACASGDQAPSHVLMALGLNEATAQASLRFGLGRYNTEMEVDYIGRRVVEEVVRSRASVVPLVNPKKDGMP